MTPPKMPADAPTKNAPRRPSAWNSGADGADTHAAPNMKTPQVKGANSVLAPSRSAASGAIETSKHEADKAHAQQSASVSSARNS